MQDLVSLKLEYFKRKRIRRRKSIIVLSVLSVFILSVATRHMTLTGITMGTGEYDEKASSAGTIMLLDKKADDAACSLRCVADIPDNNGDFPKDTAGLACALIGYNEDTDGHIFTTCYNSWENKSSVGWNFYFTVFCLNRAGGNKALCSAVTLSAWTAKLKEAGAFISADGYTAQTGDVVFFNDARNESITRTGIVTSYENGCIFTVEGDINGEVGTGVYACSDEKIAGYASSLSLLADSSGSIPAADFYQEPYSGGAAVAEYETTAEAFPKITDGEYVETESSAPSSENGRTINEAAPAARVCTYSDNNITVTAEIPPQADIPNEAQLMVVSLEKGSENYKNAVSASENEIDGDIKEQLVYDIYFEADSVRYEPASGEIKIRFDFAGGLMQTQSGSVDPVKVLHLGQESAEELEAEVELDENNYVSSVGFSSESFSPFSIVVMAASSLPAGTYGQCTFAYNYTANVFSQDSAFQTYYSADRPLGVAGSFHLVAFDSITMNSHCNGNVLTDTLYANGNFGTNGLANELSYVVNYVSVNSNSASSTSHILVLGSENVITTTDNGNALAVNDRKIDKPKNIIQDDNTATAPFIDLAAVETECAGVSSYLGNISTSGVTADFRDRNNISLTLDSPDGAGFYDMTASYLASIGSGYTLKMLGFEAGHNGTIIVNVDCTGYTQTIDMPKSLVYIDGVQQSTGEVTVFDSGKVIWNFVNCEGLTILTNQMSGSVIALGADVEICSNLNGTVIAENIVVRAESHRTDFTGTLIPANAQFLFSKNVDSVAPTSSQSFSFELEELINGVFSPVQTVTNMGSTVLFDTIDYTSAGEHWYLVYENQTPVSGYTLSTEMYVVHTTVTGLSGAYTIQNEKYKVSDSQNGVIPPENLVNSSGGINTQLLTPITNNNQLVFENKTFTGININKSWIDSDGQAVVKNNGYVTMYLYQAAVGAGDTIPASADAAEHNATVSVKISYNTDGVLSDWWQCTETVASGSTVTLIFTDSGESGNETASVLVNGNAVPLSPSFSAGQQAVYTVSFTADQNITVTGCFSGQNAGSQNVWSYSDISVAPAVDSSSGAEVLLYGTYILTPESNWSYTINNLPSEGTNSSGENISYYYYIDEESYRSEVYQNNGGISSGTIGVTNFANELDVVLPKTGGNGLRGIYLFGGLLCASAAAYFVVILCSRARKKSEAPCDADSYPFGIL